MKLTPEEQRVVDLKTLDRWDDDRSPMTLYDELVKLLQEHRYQSDGTCKCGEWVGAAMGWRVHLAALACERAVEVAKGVDSYICLCDSLETKVVERDELIAALGEVKR